MKKIVEIYRGKRKEGAYIYVEKGYKLDALPNVIREQMGPLELAMSMLLTEDKKLARAEAPKVLAAIDEQGFYLQMPPATDDYMRDIRNDKLTSKPI